MAEIKVHPLVVGEEATWSFGERNPTWRPHDLRFSARTVFDPFPAYAHDLGVVEEAVAVVSDIWAPLWDVNVYVADREEITRSNGHSNIYEGGHYEGDVYVKDEPVGLIMLSGKRVPPHPAMTRYLVAHEYGHNVEYMLNRLRQAKNLHDDDLMHEYAELRGLPESAVHHGSGGRWHDSAAEIFACDFRIIICDVEPRYWPHPGIPHPGVAARNHPALHRWWDDTATHWFNSTAEARHE